jgi:hypothetical protein
MIVVIMIMFMLVVVIIIMSMSMPVNMMMAMLHAMNHRAGRQEQQRLKESVCHQVETHRPHKPPCPRPLP